MFALTPGVRVAMFFTAGCGLRFIMLDRLREYKFGWSILVRETAMIFTA